MGHKAIDQVLELAEKAKSDSEYTYFFTLLGAAEAMMKTIVLGVVASIGDDRERNRYRLEHRLVRASGIGDWAQVLDDAVVGPASHYLVSDAARLKTELTASCKPGDWQYDATRQMKDTLEHFGIEGDDLPIKSDLRRWFRLFVTLRNKTKGHGAVPAEKCAVGANHLRRSIELIYHHMELFTFEWVYLQRNISGKYWVALMAGTNQHFDKLKKSSDVNIDDGVYMYLGSPRRIKLMHADTELLDVYYANGGFGTKSYELLSYYTGNKISGDAAAFSVPPGSLPESETHGHGDLLVQGNCFSNVPDSLRDYIKRADLEQQLGNLLVDDRRPIVTLVGRGGIGKTSLALKVIHEITDSQRYQAIIWFSSRDIDLKQNGPKNVKPSVLAIDDMAKFYAALVLSPEEIKAKGFNARTYFEGQLSKCDLGNCLFVFDNFETTQNPTDVFHWIDTYIRLPNKALITTRARDFKGDYPLEVAGMTDHESRMLINQTAQAQGVTDFLTEAYIVELIKQSEGHPYIIKVLLGEVSKHKKAVNIPRLVAGTEEILTALFERTYALLSPCAQRAFMTLSAWNSSVPRLVLEALLIQSTGERSEVERGVESLLQFSMAELDTAPRDGQEFIGLPLVASVFGKNKLNISPSKAAIQADAEILQMLGATQRGDMHLGLASRLERFLKGVSRRIEKGERYESFAPVIEAVCRSYTQGWLLLARWHIELGTRDGYEKAKEELRRFLESRPDERDAQAAWSLMARVCYYTADTLGEVHALVERSQIGSVSFDDISATANTFNQFLRDQTIELTKDEKRDFAERLAKVMHGRIGEADGQDLSRMAWLQIHLKNEVNAREYVKRGLQLDPNNPHLINLASKLNVAIEEEAAD